MMKYSIAHRIKKALSVLLCAGSVIFSALYPDPAEFSVLSYNVLAQQPYEEWVNKLFGALSSSDKATRQLAHIFNSGQRAGVFKQSFELLSSPVDFLGAQEWPAASTEQSLWAPPVAFSNPHFHETAPGSHGLYTAADETRSLGSRAGNVYTSNRFIAEVRKVKNVPVGDYKVLFINCHLPHGQDKQDAVITEIRNHLTTQITTYKVHDCVLFGDFNTDAFGETGRERINGLLQSLPHPDEKPWKNAAKKEFGKMWYKETTMRGQTVDFMFYTSGLYLKMLEKSPSADLISKAPVPTGASIPELKWCSDHAALFACFQVNVLHPSYLSRITGHQQAVAEAQRDAEADRAEQKQDRQDRRAERLKERLEAEKKVCDTLTPEVAKNVEEMRESECLAWQTIADEAKDRRSQAQGQENARRKHELDFRKALEKSCGRHHTDDFPGGQSNHKKQTGGREKSPASSSSEGRNGTSSSSSLSCSASCAEGRKPGESDDTDAQEHDPKPKKKKKKKKKTTTASSPAPLPQPPAVQPLQPREYAHDHEALLDQLSKLLDTSPTSRSILKIEEHPFPACFQEFLNRELRQEATEGNSRRVEILLGCGANPNVFHITNVPTELASKLQCREQKLADPECQVAVDGTDNMDSFTPLMLACHGGDHQTVEQLLKAGADVNAQSKYWRLSPLMLSCNGGDIQCCTLLLNHKKYQQTAPELLLNITDRTMEPATAHAYQSDKNGGDEDGSLFDLLVKRGAWPVRGNCNPYKDDDKAKFEDALRTFYETLKGFDLREKKAHQSVEQLIKDLFTKLNRAEVKIFRHPFAYAYAIIRSQGDKCSVVDVLLPIPACLCFAQDRNITYASAKDFGNTLEILMHNGASCLHDSIYSTMGHVDFAGLSFGKNSNSLSGAAVGALRSQPEIKATMQYQVNITPPFTFAATLLVISLAQFYPSSYTGVLTQISVSI